MGFLVDWLPVIVINVLFYWFGPLRYIGSLLGIGYIAYLGYLDGVLGQTPGKMIMGTRLVDASGQLLGAGQGIGRKFAHILDSLVCMLGWFLPIVDTDRQTIADKVMTTYVVTGAEKKSFSVDLWMPPKPAA